MILPCRAFQLCDAAIAVVAHARPAHGIRFVGVENFGIWFAVRKWKRGLTVVGDSVGVITGGVGLAALCGSAWILLTNGGISIVNVVRHPIDARNARVALVVFLAAILRATSAGWTV
jgi:hypothetical protein